MSSSDTTPAPTVAGTHSYLAPVLQAIFKAITEGGGRCVATLAKAALLNTQQSQPRAMRSPKRSRIGLLEQTERRSYCAVSLPDILTYGKC